MARKRVFNESRLRRKLRRFPEELRKDIRKAMEQSADELVQEIRARAPKDEGQLAENATARISRDGLSAQIGYSKNKSGFKRAWKRGGFTALFQEFGTAHHSAQPFIRPSYRAKLTSILDKIDRAVSNTLQRASRGDF